MIHLIYFKYLFIVVDMAFALMGKNGLDTSSFDFGYVKDIDKIDKLITKTKESVSKVVKLSEKSLDALKIKEKTSTLGMLESNKDKIKSPIIKTQNRNTAR